ncbi:YetF domain-containing protein [Planococcus sp. ISL-110]|uniref:YetF domain-containing protein n=1 Tax=Planococcus sp. ISL-110 TaxID=2819167 RepID=UPI001BEB53CA|nr:YetF domain-containing protein [Planococcus sp. ISL-110]MBT2571152.1 DUF421 domain-containing protein [Planococcus sp. ISL-110]
MKKNAFIIIGLLYYQGKFYEKAMLKTRVPKTEILQKTREQGLVSLDMVEAVVIENNGKISILKKSENQEVKVLEDVTIIE